MFLVCYSATLSSDNSRHFNQEQDYGMCRSPTIQDNMHHIDWASKGFLNQENWDSVLQAMIKKGYQTKTSIEAALALNAKLRKREKFQIPDKLQDFPGLTAETFAPTKYIEGVAAYKPPADVTLTFPGCADQYTGFNQYNNGIVQAINSVLEVDTPQKQMQSGLFHSNGLMAFKLMQNPDVCNDGSVTFLGEQLNQNTLVDINHFAN